MLKKLCCSTVKSLVINAGKHGGEATVEAVKLIAELIKAHNCLLHPDSVEVSMSLSFDEDLGKPENPDSDNKAKSKKSRKRKGVDESNQVPDNEWKNTRKEMLSKTRKETLKLLHLLKILKKKKDASETLSAVFQIFFCILKHAAYPVSKIVDSSKSSCQLSVSEWLRCCIVAFKVMRNNLDALFYNLLLEYRPGRDEGEVLAEALKIMLCDDRQHDMQRAAAFIKHLVTFSLCFGSAESMAALVTTKHPLQKNVKCRNLLENDAGGGSVAGAIAKYLPHATDPNRSDALASVLWELNLLTKHCYPAVAAMALNVSTTSTSNNQVYHSHVSPQQAYAELSLENKSNLPSGDVKQANGKKRKANVHVPVKSVSFPDLMDQTAENEVIRDIFLLFYDLFC
ncbi:nucleolar complex-associated protein 3-like [Primulina eburnea]|uniref:nucleolar complex-associated protein 3-like n=1 Tax=Primulina eburnea TaxID=1245227 RepID=UPI003C6CA3B1